MKPECRQKNATGLSMVSVGVNKSADQFQILDDETREELAAGSHHDPRRGSYGKRPTQSAPGAPARPGAAKTAARTQAASPQGPRGSWTASQERLALVYNERGLRPDEIAEKLGLSRYTVTQMILAARNRPKRS
jgi:hypothetical protein